MDGSIRFILVCIILTIGISAAKEKEKIAQLFRENSICLKESELLEKCIQLNCKNEDISIDACESEKMQMDICIKLNNS
ncbi:unnamed protein product [Chironomus riparius]|uniref:Uncharacterized protein n=1 Tax=Chironomus riparius TaxID=315576 RepID=A0A9N9SCF5_9DIPT|nr:unnamed protein product [Chironomus riparius]